MRTVLSDDFLVVGPAGEIRSFYWQLSDILELTCAVLGDGPKDSKIGSFLGRRISWESWGIAWEGDRKILSDMLVEWGMDECALLNTPCSKEEKSQLNDLHDKYIEDSARATMCRRGAAKLNYLSLDDPRISFSSKLISHEISRPTEGTEQ